jgi:hypothetical protein
VDTTTTTTSTSFTTTTVSTTNTVAAPAGFTPLLEAPDYVAKVKARAVQQAAAPVIPGLRAGQQLYAQRIDCTKRVPYTTIKSITTTVQGPRKTLQPKTKTKTITTTETIVETSYPPDVTETETETVSPTTTVQTIVTHEATSVETGKSILYPSHAGYVLTSVPKSLLSLMCLVIPSTPHVVATTSCELPTEVTPW